jgi:hypothetical protein
MTQLVKDFRYYSWTRKFISLFTTARYWILSETQDTQHNTHQERIQPTNLNTHAHRKDLYNINNTSNSRIQQFPYPKILSHDDDDIGRNM